MNPGTRLALWTAAAVVLVVAVSVAVSEFSPRPLAYRTELGASRYLYFRNVRSADYDRIERDGMTIYLPEDRDSAGWFQIVVLWRDDRAHIVWETPPSRAHSVIQLPDRSGMWDPDTAHLDVHWWAARRSLDGVDDPPYVLLDYFRMVVALPESLE